MFQSTNAVTDVLPTEANTRFARCYPDLHWGGAPSFLLTGVAGRFRLTATFVGTRSHLLRMKIQCLCGHSVSRKSQLGAGTSEGKSRSYLQRHIFQYAYTGCHLGCCIVNRCNRSQSSRTYSLASSTCSRTSLESTCIHDVSKRVPNIKHAAI